VLPLPQDNTEDVIEGQVVLFGSRCKNTPMGNLKLSRQVVSVQLQGKLRVIIQSYASSGCIVAHKSIFMHHSPRMPHKSTFMFDWWL
jgi:hypothetical protein